MYILRFTRTDDHYMITDHNDEKLWVLGELLLDKEALHQVAQLVASEQEHNFGPKFHIFKQNPIILIDYLKDKHAEKPLTIEIEQGLLLDIIDYWKTLMEQKPLRIILQRSQDTYTIAEESI